MSERPRVLLVGESWMTTGNHVKGFNEFSTGFYEEGHAALSAALQPRFDLQHLPSHLAATQFPDTAHDLAQYSAILFSDVGSDTLLLHPDTFIRFLPRPNRLHAVREYVANGGGFAMIGGYMSFAGIGGKAHYHRTPVEQLLPVTILPYDDRVEVPEGFAPQVVSRDHPVVAGLSVDWPILLGYNRLAAKPDAQVVLIYDQDPILVTGFFGRGRTAAFASDCSPHWGSAEFVAWSHYGAFWNRLVDWLACRDGASS
jgi:uncharacterized membrane protein